jgi:hypothetical protein
MKTFHCCLVTGGLFLMAHLILLAPPMAAEDKTPPRDYKDLDLKMLGVEPVPAKKDPKTGFIVAGKNSTSVIKGLTELNGRPISDLEKDMRPGAETPDGVGSTKGFLGAEEKLLEVLAADNKFVVEESGLTHQHLAHHLHVLTAIGVWQYKEKKSGQEFVYHGKRFKVEVWFAKGHQKSPFRDGTQTNTDVHLHNLDNGVNLSYSALVPHLIEKYGFYEGEGTPYRVPPRAILKVLDFLKPASKN